MGIMIYNNLRKQLRELIVKRNINNCLKLLDETESLNYKLSKIKNNLNEGLKNKFDCLTLEMLTILENTFYQTSYELISQIDFISANAGFKKNKTTDLMFLKNESNNFPHSLIVDLEKIAQKEGIIIASIQSKEFEITKKIISNEEYQIFFEKRTKPKENILNSKTGRNIIELYNLLFESRRLLLQDYIQKIYHL